MPIPHETCYACVNGVTTITVYESNKPPQLVKLKCVVCNGTTQVPRGTKQAWDAFWCQCGNPSGNVTHSREGTDIYRCNDCGAVVQTG